MKKILFAVMAVYALASCDNVPEPDLPEIPTERPEGTQVDITLGTDGETRAFFANTASAETWEKEIKTLTVYVFDESEKFILKHSADDTEVRERKMRFVLPAAARGMTCSFYFVANADYGYVETVSEMNNLTEAASLDEYNGTFAEVAGGCLRPGGFVMTAVEKEEIPLTGYIMSFPVTIKRVVAKIAVRARPGDSFGSLHNGGTVTINSIKLSKASARSYSFYQPGVYPSRESLYEASQETQKSGDHCNGLFYVYETDMLGAGNRVTLTLYGYFDRDGNADTAYDRPDVEYRIEIAGLLAGKIRRNGYYRIDAVIDGLSDDTVSANISAAAFEVPATQIFDLGD
jgi:hypothetical protein